MTSSFSDQPVLVSAPARLARLGGNHGYRFEGDAVHLQVLLNDVTRGAHASSWSLQLWACPAGATTPVVPGAHRVAEAWLPPLSEVAEGELEVVAAATPPAGTAAWTMVLALVAARDEHFDEVHDFSAYPRLETFLLPRFEGGVVHRITGDQVRLEVDTIANPRAARNVSGTLSLELWALSEPYAGGAFEGVWMAGAVLGNLGGQAQWHALALDLPCIAPPAGRWQQVLMLREWIGNGYITRDYTNGIPLVIASAAPDAKSDPPPASVAPVPHREAAVPAASAKAACTKPRRTKALSKRRKRTQPRLAGGSTERPRSSRKFIE
jgi:hypothetical protein